MTGLAGLAGMIGLAGLAGLAGVIGVIGLPAQSQPYGQRGWKQAFCKALPGKK